MSLKSRIEAVLFISGKALSVEEIAEVLNEPAEDIEMQLLELIMDYSSRDGALEVDDEDGYIIQVREEYMDIVEKMVPVEFSQAVLKTLSVIAIKEPIRQAHLKELRGANAYEHVQELEEKGMISRKRDKKNGRSFIIRTTPKFAEYFKIKGDTNVLAKMIEQQRKISD